MALVNCPECRKEISDKAVSCPNCGAPIANTTKNNKKISISNKLKKTIVVSILSCIVIGIIAIIGYSCASKEIEYRKALENFEKENYKEAYEYFNTSDYKESAIYLQNTLERYTSYLISTNQFYEASAYLAQIKNEEIVYKLSKESDYLHAIYNYEQGAFDAALMIFKTLDDYKDSSAYLEKVKFMRKLQGEWILKYYRDSEYHNRGAMNIEGWHATTYHCVGTGDKFDEVGSCKLEMNSDKGLKFKTDDIEYDIYLDEVHGYLGATLIKDSFYERLRSQSPLLTPWCYGNTTDDLAFTKPKQNEIINGKAITPNPEIGMSTAEIEQSSWGKPNKINKTTYSWGTTEQWCYPNYKYIYFDNGIVTAISE